MLGQVERELGAAWLDKAVATSLEQLGLIRQVGISPPPAPLPPADSPPVPAVAGARAAQGHARPGAAADPAAAGRLVPAAAAGGGGGRAGAGGGGGGGGGVGPAGRVRQRLEHNGRGGGPQVGGGHVGVSAAPKRWINRCLTGYTAISSGRWRPCRSLCSSRSTGPSSATTCWSETRTSTTNPGALSSLPSSPLPFAAVSVASPSERCARSQQPEEWAEHEMAAMATKTAVGEIGPTLPPPALVRVCVCVSAHAQGTPPSGVAAACPPSQRPSRP